MSKKSHIGTVKAASIITIITLVSKAFGFVREVLIAYYFGTSSEVDMYLIAVNIPTIVLGFITCIGTAYIPVYNEISVKEGNKKSLGFTTQLIIVMSVVCGVVILICSLNAEFLTEIVAPGFSAEMVSTTAGYLRISMWNLLMTTIISIFICYLNSNNKFSQAALCMLFHSSVQIVFTIMAHYIGPVFLTIGFVIANCCYLGALLFTSLRYEYKFSTIFYDNKYGKMLLKLFIPIAVSSLVTQINGYVDKYFASGLVEGSIAALNYSNTIRTFVIMMLNTGLITIFFPTVSRMVSEGKMDRVRQTLISSIRYVIIVFIPITVLFILFAEPITSLLFARGQFNLTSVEMTSIAVRMYAIGITAVALRDIFFNFYYSVKDTSFTLIISILSILVNIGLNALMVKKLGIGGLAFATSAAAIITLPIFALRLKKHLKKGQSTSGLAKYSLQCAGANLVPLILVLSINRIVGNGNIIILAIIEGCVYIVLYYLILRIMNVKETKMLKDMMNRVIDKIKK